MTIVAPVTMPRAGQVLTSRTGLTSPDVAEAHATVSELFCEHRLTALTREGVQMRLRSAQEDGVGVVLLDYGDPVRITPVGLESFHLVQIPLSGHARMTVGNAEVESSPHVATLPPIERDFSMVWDHSTPQLIVYVERSRLLTAAEGVFGRGDPSGLRLAPRMDLDTSAGQAFLRSVFEFHDLLERGPAASRARALSAELMLTNLSGAVDTSLSQSLTEWDYGSPREMGRGNQHYRRFVEWIEENNQPDLGIAGIARELGIPLRTLQDHVQDASGVSPSALLRDARFRRAHQMLSQADSTQVTVTSVAQECGFAHLGRFSVDYRARFGESPHHTLRR